MKLVSLAESKAKPCVPWEWGDKRGRIFPGTNMLEGMEHLVRTTKLPGGLVGVALAAPQVGLFYRCFVIALPGQPARWVFNPRITWASPRSVDAVEGCLTVPGEKFVVSRARSLSLSGQHEDGRDFTWKRCNGLLARIIQHEVGHLDGVCVKDFAKPVTVHQAGAV